MKCENCSGTVRPVVVFDIDGTLGEWHQHFIDFCKWFLDLPHLPPAWRFDGRLELHEFLRLPLEVYREAKLAFRQGGYKRMMPMTLYANSCTYNAKILGYDVWVATTRPYLRYDSIDKDTREWLRRNGIEYDGLVYADDKFSMLTDSVDPERIMAVVDDLPGNIERAMELFPKADCRLLTRAHNEHRDDLLRVPTFQHFSEVLSEQARVWAADERGNN